MDRDGEDGGARARTPTEQRLAEAKRLRCREFVTEIGETTCKERAAEEKRVAAEEKKLAEEAAKAKAAAAKAAELAKEKKAADRARAAELKAA